MAVRRVGLQAAAAVWLTTAVAGSAQSAIRGRGSVWASGTMCSGETGFDAPFFGQELPIRVAWARGCESMGACMWRCVDLGLAALALVAPRQQTVVEEDVL